jgi:hypothetical protein
VVRAGKTVCAARTPRGRLRASVGLRAGYLRARYSRQNWLRAARHRARISWGAGGSLTPSAPVRSALCRHFSPDEGVILEPCIHPGSRDVGRLWAGTGGVPSRHPRFVPQLEARHHDRDIDPEGTPSALKRRFLLRVTLPGTPESATGTAHAPYETGLPLPPASLRLATHLCSDRGDDL